MEAISAALDGLKRAQEMVDNSARRIAASGAPPVDGSVEPAADVVDLSAAVVGLLEARNAYAANVRVLDATLDLQKNLLDVLG